MLARALLFVTFHVFLMRLFAGTYGNLSFVCSGLDCLPGVNTKNIGHLKLSVSYFRTRPKIVKIGHC